MKLSERMEKVRILRPDEWLMDSFIAAVYRLEDKLELLASGGNDNDNEET